MLSGDSKKIESKTSDEAKQEMLKKAPLLSAKLFELIKKNVETSAGIESKIKGHFEGVSRDTVSMLMFMEKLLDFIEPPIPVLAINSSSARAGGVVPRSSIGASQKKCLLERVDEVIQGPFEEFHKRVVALVLISEKIFMLKQSLPITLLIPFRYYWSIVKHFDQIYQEKFIIEYASQEKAKPIEKLQNLCRFLSDDDHSADDIDQLLMTINDSSTLKSWIEQLKEKTSKGNTFLEEAVYAPGSYFYDEGLIYLFGLLDIEEFKSTIDASPKIYEYYRKRKVESFERMLDFAMRKKPDRLLHILYIIKGETGLDREQYIASIYKACEVVLLKVPALFPEMAQMAKSILGYSIFELINNKSENILMIAANGDKESFKLVLDMTESKEINARVKLNLFKQTNIDNQNILIFAAQRSFQNFTLLLDHLQKTRSPEEIFAMIAYNFSSRDNFLDEAVLIDLKNQGSQILLYTIIFLRKINPSMLIDLLKKSGTLHHLFLRLGFANIDSEDAVKLRIMELLQRLFLILEQMQKDGYKYLNLAQNAKLILESLILAKAPVLYKKIISMLEALNETEAALGAVIYAGLEVAFYNSVAFKDIFQYIVKKFSFKVQLELLSGGASGIGLLHKLIETKSYDAINIMLDMLMENGHSLPLLTEVLARQSLGLKLNELSVIYRDLNACALRSQIGLTVNKILKATLMLKDEAAQKKILLHFNTQNKIDDAELWKKVVKLISKLEKKGPAVVTPLVRSSVFSSSQSSQEKKEVKLPVPLRAAKEKIELPPLFGEKNNEDEALARSDEDEDQDGSLALAGYANRQQIHLNASSSSSSSISTVCQGVQQMDISLLDVDDISVGNNDNLMVGITRKHK